MQHATATPGWARVRGVTVTDDPLLDARFAEQILADFPDAEIAIHGIVTSRHTSFPDRLLRMLWAAQGRPRHRGLITRVGQIWQHPSGRWTFAGWHFEGRYCLGVPSLELEQVDGVVTVRALCGWHLPDLFRIQRARSPWLIRLKEIW